MSKEKLKSDAEETHDVETTGHTWDGIEELNNPLPRWWLWCFYLTIVWGVAYTIAYPAWPLVNSATAGLLGYSTRQEVAQEIQRVEEQNAEVSNKLAQSNLSELSTDDPAYHFGVSGGASVYRAQCSQCHGSGAAGAKGYPNLLDDDWLWGGSLKEIEYTIRHGVRNETDSNAHWSQMPAFGEILDKKQIVSVAEYVLGLSGQDNDPDLASIGQTVFAQNCASCHGDGGEGMREQGAPRLNDAIWLYGDDRASLIETITYSRFGVMPAWGQRLDDADVKALTLYIHQLGGGE